ncbi:MAG: hypothetical protein GF347_03990 [Candidatus Moranbacteria bacterium]|nr:hypothetical protein [Candidatus Moranbacteria bacterium]
MMDKKVKIGKLKDNIKKILEIEEEFESLGDYKKKVNKIIRDYELTRKKSRKK